MRKIRKTNLSKRHSLYKPQHADSVPDLMESMPFGLHRYLLKPDGDLIYIGGNAAADQILGIGHQALVGKKIEAAFPNLAATDIPNAYRQIAKNGGQFEREFVRYQDEHKESIFKVQAFQTGPNLMAVLFQDIGDKKETERALAESEERYRRLFEDAALGIFQSSPEGKALSVNPAFARMFGYSSPAEVVATVQNVAADIFADPNRRAEIAGMVQANPDQNLFENIYRRKDGSTFPGTLHLHPVKDSAGRLLYFEGLIEDITRRKQAESALLESERRLRSLIDATPLGLHQYELSPAGALILTGANPAADQILGIEHRALVGLPIEDAFPLHRQTEIPALYRQVAQQGEPYSCEQIAYQDDKIHGVFEIHAFQTGPARMAVFFQDITAKKKAEEDLRESEEKFRMLVEQNFEGVVLFDEQGRAIEWNAAQERSSGISRQEALGRPAWDLQFQVLPPEQKTPAQYALMKARGIRLIQTGQSPTFYQSAEILIHRPDGKQVTIQQTAFPIKTNAGFRIGSIMRDITDRKQADMDLRRQMERLTALRAIDQSILSLLGLGQTLDVLLDKITALLQVDAADILLFNPQMKTLKVSARRGLSSAVWEETLLLGESHAGRVAQTREIEIIPDLGQIQDSLTEKILQVGEGFVSYVAEPLVARGELKGVLQIFTRSRLEPSPDWIGFLEALADQAAIAISSAQLLNEQQQTNARLTRAYEDTIDGWSRALDLRDSETEGHSQRVTDLTLELARRMHIPEDQLVHIRRGAKLHDIGKMGIPDNLLYKPGLLTVDEWQIMRMHPTYAADLLYPIEFLSPALEIPFGHHEKWDGTGYPQGLKGTEIPLAARVFAVIDVWDALTHVRPYRPAWTEQRALDYIREQSGTHFDPDVVEQFLAMIGEPPTAPG